MFPAPGRTEYIKREYAKSKLKTCNPLILSANGARIPSSIRGFVSRHLLHAGASSNEGSIVHRNWRSRRLRGHRLLASREGNRVSRRRAKPRSGARTGPAAVEIAALEGSKLHAQLDKLFEDEEGGLIAMPIISEILRQVGFSRWYDTGEELLQAIVDACSN
jgi:hypothetical protein